MNQSIQPLPAWPAKRVIPILLLVATLSGCTEDPNVAPVNPVVVSPAPITGSLQGTITSAKTGQPLHGVSILTDPPSQSVISDSTGNFSISDIIPTGYKVIPRKEGYLIEPVSIQVLAGNVAKADFLAIRDGKDNVIDFDGKSTFILVKDNAKLDLSTNNFTIEFYAFARTFKASSTNDRWNCVVSHGTSNADLDFLAGFQEGSPVLFVRSNDTGYVARAKLKTHKWYHIAFVQNTTAQKITIYIDGLFDSQLPLRGTATTTYGDLFIGAREYLNSGAASHYFDGIIYELRLWNTARTVTEINQTLKTHLTGNESGLVAYWPLNDGASLSVQDKGPQSHSGIIRGDFQWTRITGPFGPG